MGGRYLGIDLLKCHFLASMVSAFLLHIPTHFEVQICIPPKGTLGLVGTTDDAEVLSKVYIDVLKSFGLKMATLVSDGYKSEAGQ